MFTGIVETVAEVLAVEDGERSRRLVIAYRRLTPRLAVGRSVAVDGVCLTVVSVRRDRFSVDVGAETLRRTTLDQLSRGARVNLERSLRVDQQLDGHIMQGHVDGVGTVARIEPEGASKWMEVTVPQHLMPYLVEKGSVALDGVSLTVARLRGDGFAVSLVPYTLAATTLGEKRIGDVVNVEVDILAKYVERLLAVHLQRARGSIDAPTL